MDTITRYDAHEHYDYVANHTDFDTRDHRGTVATTKIRPVAVECGSGWYHDAAIADAKDALAHPYR